MMLTVVFCAVLAWACWLGMVRGQDVAFTQEPSVREAQSAEEKLFRDRDAIIRLMMWSMLYLEKRAPLLDRMPMEGVHRAFLESYIAVPVRLVEECPPDYRKVFWLVDAMSKAFLQRMEKEKLAGKELIREYGVYVKACNELLLPVVSRYPLSERFQQVDRELRRQMKAATDREALITALMEQMEDVERSLPPPEKEGAVSPEKKCGEKEE